MKAFTLIKTPKSSKILGTNGKDITMKILTVKKLKENFQQYFRVFPWHLISKDSEGFDMGCGSGRWAHFVAPKVRLLNCVEPSDAIEVAKRNLAHLQNISYFQETTEECSVETGSQDFGYCLGVLHHIPQAEAALRDCSELLKPGAPMLVYIYYNFENRPKWFRFLWPCQTSCVLAFQGCQLAQRRSYAKS